MMPAKVDGRSLGVQGRVLPKPAEAGLPADSVGAAGAAVIGKKPAVAKKSDKPVFKEALKQASKKPEGSEAEEGDDSSNAVVAKKPDGKDRAQTGRTGKKKALTAKEGKKVVGDGGQVTDVEGEESAAESDGAAPVAVGDGTAEDEAADVPEEQAPPVADSTDDEPVDGAAHAAEQGVVQPAVTPASGNRVPVSAQDKADGAGPRVVEGVRADKGDQKTSNVSARDAAADLKQVGEAGPIEGVEVAASEDGPETGANDEIHVATAAKPVKSAKTEALTEVSAGERAGADEKTVVASAPAVLPDSPAEEAPESLEISEDLRPKVSEPKVAQGQTPAVTGGVEIGTGKGSDHATGQTGPAAPPVEVMFAEANHTQIVSAVRGELLPRGGTMHIRLDPPELGALQVTVHVQDGVVTASFQTSNEDATRLLSHSLSQLKHVLESQGVSVDKLHVQQGPRDSGSGGEGDARQRQDGGESSQQEQWREHQRRQMMRRVWAKLADAERPLDVVG